MVREASAISKEVSSSDSSERRLETGRQRRIAHAQKCKGFVHASVLDCESADEYNAALNGLRSLFFPASGPATKGADIERFPIEACHIGDRR
jgi:hypothetical protein